jgi:hypothetical protein
MFRSNCEIPFSRVLSINEQTKVFGITEHLLTLTNDDEINLNMARLAVRSEDRLNNKPSRRDLAIELWQHKTCECMDRIPRSTAITIIDKLLSWKMTIWECEFILVTYEYVMTNSRLPSLDELLLFMDNLDRFHEDQIRFAEENKVYIGANISNFESTNAVPDDTSCCLCCGTIDVASKHYKLPCNHIYHFDENDCIEGTVKRWFEKNTKCPMCRTDMRDHGATEIRDSTLTS